MTRLRFTRRAVLEFWREAEWWVEYRPKHPALFEEEVQHASSLLKASPSLGVPYPAAHIPGMRRFLLPGSRYHLFYLYDPSEDLVTVIAIWSAQRRRGPSLRRL